MFRSWLIKICQNYHEYVHFFFGLISFFIVLAYFPHSSWFWLLLVALIGSIFPDIDHLFYLFGYGRHHAYSLPFHQYLKNRDISAAIEYCRQNHKFNHYILSHNLLTPVFLYLIFLYFLQSGHSLMAVFFLAMVSHFVFDVAEDFLVLGRLNSNWYLKFSQKKL